jgi:SAM-dependent methyltransferase
MFLHSLCCAIVILRAIQGGWKHSNPGKDNLMVFLAEFFALMLNSNKNEAIDRSTSVILIKLTYKGTTKVAGTIDYIKVDWKDYGVGMKGYRASSPNLDSIQAKYTYRNPLLRYANRRFLKTILEMLSLISFHSLLDVGSGEGVVLDYINKSFQTELLGMDLDPNRVEVAQQLDPDGSFFVGDAQALPFEDNSFDIIIMLEVLEHVGNPHLALKEARRVTRNYLLASVPHEPWWRLGNLARLKYLRTFGNTPEHIHHWTLRGFQSLIRPHFSILAIKTPALWSFVLAQKGS